MNLFKKHNRFESNIQRQISNLEAKPSDLLWQRIDAGMSTDGFETVMQNSVSNFEQTPYPETWNHIENELPSPKPKSPFLKFYGGAAILLLIATGAWIGILWNQHDPLRNESTQVATQSQPELPTSAFRQRNESAQVAIQSPQLANQSDNKPTSVTSTKPIEVLTPKQRKQQIKTPQINTNDQLLLADLSSTNAGAKINTTQNNAIKPSASNPKTYPTNSISNSNRKLSNQGIAPIIENKNEDAKPPEVTNYAVPKNDAEMLSATTKNSALPNDSNTAKTTSLMPKEISQNDSLPLAITELSKSPKTKDKEDLSRFSISVYAGAMMSYATYEAPNANLTSLNFEDNIAFREQVERPAVDWAGGFILDYHLNERWMISSGLMMLNFYQQFKYNSSRAATPANPNEIGVPVFNPNDTFSVGQTLSSRIKYSWSEIPILVSYKMLQGKRFNFYLQGGMSYGFLGTVDGNMVSYDNKGVLVLSDKQSFPQIQNMFFATIMPQLSYSFKQNVSLGCVPTFKYGLNSMIGNDRWVQQHPYFIGLNLCLRKRF